MGSAGDSVPGSAVTAQELVRRADFGEPGRRALLRRLAPVGPVAAHPVRVVLHREPAVSDPDLVSGGGRGYPEDCFTALHEENITGRLGFGQD